jgi:NAD(P)-dependent dehydrogenase (short-subunit alcohol dehydrogenase family)
MARVSHGTCRNSAAETKLQRLAQDTEGMLTIVAMDVTDAESVREAATQLKDIPIDVLINSAGIAGVPAQKTGNVDYESWWSRSRVVWARSPTIRLAAPSPVAAPRRP